MDKQEFNKGDCFISLLDKDTLPFFLIEKVETGKDGLTYLTLTNIDDKASPKTTVYPVLFMEKHFSKVSESTVKILYGAKYVKLREKIEKS